MALMFAVRFVSDQVNFIRKLYIRNVLTSTELSYATQSFTTPPTPRIKPAHPRSLNLQPDCIAGPGLRLR